MIASKRAPLEALCRRFHVRRLEVFGSASRGDFDPQHSDLDFLVEFEPASPHGIFDAYFSVKEELEALFGRQVDLVMLDAVENPYVRADIERTRQLLYAA